MAKHLLRVIAVALCVMLTTSAWASPAYPGLLKFKQPDGKVIGVYIFGDEFLHWAETEDGYTLLYDKEGYLSYAEREVVTGNLVPSKIRPANNSGQRKAREREFLKTQGKRLRFSNAQIETAKRLKELMQPSDPDVIGGNTLMRAPRRNLASKSVTGDKRMLLILVEFTDVRFKHTKQDFDMLMNQLNYTDDGRFGSVKDFYLENSFGKLNLTTDVVGVYRLSNKREYYGGHSLSGNDKNPWAMATEAVKLADADVNYADYDNDGDGTVDGVHIIYAGPGEEAGGGSNCIWAHQSVINVTLDNKRLYRYSCSPEIRGSGGSKMTHIGVICHEIGHVLGCMDFYDTNYESGGQYQGLGQWDLMASGNWNCEGACPAHFNPYVKIYDFGWAEPIDANKATTLTLEAKSEAGFARIDTKTQGEYFLLEYRAQSGFDTFVPGHGLMVYRASADLPDALARNIANATHRQKFYPLCANANAELPTGTSSYGTVNSASAPFPGNNKVYSLTDYTTPSMKSWAGAMTDFPITSIDENLSDESITFDVAGGTSGGAYGLKVTASDLSSISLTWEKQNNGQQVLLVHSETLGAGAPQSGKTYSAGDIIDDCGTVIYFGTDTKFTHSNLEEGKEYYYSLFTQKSNGSWTTPRIQKARTQIDIIRNFPYVNNFEEGVLDDSWKQEHILSSRMQWVVTDLNERYSNVYTKHTYKLEAKFTDFPQSKEQARIKLPKLDFTDKQCAAISFKYSNFMAGLALEYRMSPTDEWHTLRTFDSMFNGVGTSVTATDVGDATREVTIKLPNITSTYELSFVATYYRHGNSYSGIESVLIDDLQIDADYDVMVLTGKATQALGTEATVEIEAFDGLKQIDERGTEWSLDQNTWNAVTSSTNEVQLTGLAKGSTIYYRAYAIDQDGVKHCGSVKTLETMSFSNGQGTVDDPYIIASANDWKSFRSCIEGGNTCSNAYFALGASFTLSSNTTISKTFNGTLDGCGYTITPASGTYKSLFYILGQDGCIKNLNVKATTLSTGGFESAGICSCNIGLITGCNVDFGTIELSNGRNFGGIVAKNNGWITNCTSNLKIKAEQPWVGGICWYNYNVISGCTSYGEMVANNNSHIGGISALNYEGSKEGKRANGLISNCRNYADISNYCIDNKSYSYTQGGICASSQGRIEYCANYGSISHTFGGDASTGGIVGNASSSLVTDCVNYGKITLDNSNNTQSSSCHAGGIVGYYDQNANIKNCLNVGEIELTGTYNFNSYGAIGGTNRESAMENCWYTNDFQDQAAVQGTAAEAIEALNCGQADGGQWVMDGNNVPALRSMLHDTWFTVDRITGLATDHINVMWAASGSNLSGNSLQWRKVGERLWNDVAGKDNVTNNISITGLTPKTLYEIRGLVHTTTGETITTNVDTVATMFAGTGMANEPFIIDDYNELLAFACLIAHGETFCTQKVVLGHDIDMRGAEGVLWNPMRSELSTDYFQGEFDGAGHVLHNMKIDTRTNYVGFFAMSNGYIHDLTLRNAYIKARPAYISSWSIYETGPGVGGFVGYTYTSDTNYPHLLERCGFEGEIHGGYCIGALAGNVLYDDAVKDCYANAQIYSNDNGMSFYVGGLIGRGNALNSYFAGKITNLNGIYFSSGPVSAKSYDSSHPDTGCFYVDDCGASSSSSTSKSAAEMQDQGFLASLTADVWAFVPGMGDGFPVLAACNTTRVTTDEAKAGEDGNATLCAIACDGDAGSAVQRGFQYFSTQASTMEINQLTSTDKGTFFKAVLNRNAIPKTGVNYRAYSIYNANDTVFGDWKLYVPAIILPKLNLITVTMVDGTCEANYAIDNGTETIVKCSLVTIGCTDTRIENTLDPNSTNGVIELPDLDDAPYISYITCTISDGREFVSNTVIWEMQAQQSIAEMYLTDGVEYAYNVTQENMTVTYERDFKSLGWQPLYIPFTLSESDWQDKVKLAQINNVVQYDDDEDGEIDRTIIIFNTRKGGDIQPNTPYLVKPFETGEMMFRVENTTLMASPDEDAYVDCASTKSIFKILGTYQEKSGLGDNAYGFADGKFVKLGEEDCILPFGIYITIEERNSSSGLRNAPRRSAQDTPQEIHISIDGEEIEECEFALAKGWNWVSSNVSGINDAMAFIAPIKDNVSRFVSQTEELVNDPVYGLVGNLATLDPTKGYKLCMNEATTLSLTETIYDPSLVPVVLEKGWNWLGFTPNEPMAVDEALSNLSASECDLIKGRDAFATFTGGEWVGDLAVLEPESGYMYHSSMAKAFIYPARPSGGKAVEAASARRLEAVHPWEVSPRKYADNATVIASLLSADQVVDAGGGWCVGAFVDGECRGVGKWVKGRIFITIHGESGDGDVSFRAINSETMEECGIAETIRFADDMVGTVACPLQLHMSSEATGIAGAKTDKGAADIYTVSGVKVQRASRPGVYVVNGRKVVVR